MKTPQDIITRARNVYNDADSAGYRKSDLELLDYVNDGISEVSALRPELFETVGDVQCTQGQVEQAVTFADAQVLLGVLCIHGGSAVTPFDIKAMDAFNPGWRTDPEGPCKQWQKYPGNPLRFFIHPPAPADQTVDVMYVRNPTVLGLSDTISEIPEGYTPALVDYVIYRAESADDEHSNSGRAANHFNSFVSKIKGV